MNRLLKSLVISSKLKIVQLIHENHVGIFIRQSHSWMISIKIGPVRNPTNCSNKHTFVFKIKTEYTEGSTVVDWLSHPPHSTEVHGA